MKEKRKRKEKEIFETLVDEKSKALKLSFT